MKVKTKKSTRGGARKGAGRRALGKVVMLLRVKPETRKSIQAESEASGVTLGAVIDAKFATEKRTGSVTDEITLGGRKAVMPENHGWLSDAP